MKADDIRRGGLPPPPPPKKAPTPIVVKPVVAKPVTPKPAPPKSIPVAKLVPAPPKKKVPWPGDWAIHSAGAYCMGLSKDRSGVEAINKWGTTATPEEKEQNLKRCESYGFLEGMGFGWFSVKALLRVFGW